MANSCSKIMLGYAPWDFPARSPGPLGICDAASPASPLSFVGDTPGSVGLGDGGAASPVTTFPVASPSKSDVLKRAAEFLIQEEQCPTHPYWPGGKSGVTWGVGWDASQQTEATLQRDWGQMPKADFDKLKTALGTKNSGDTAKALLPSLSKITIPPEVSLSVLREHTLPDYYKRTLTAFPGMTALPLEVQVALISLVYNRGARMGDRDKVLEDRREMRNIREAVAEADLARIARELRSMERLWVGTKIEKGMKRRRETEAGLVEKAIKRSPDYVPTVFEFDRLTLA